MSYYLGLTGGIASGKSTITNHLRSMGMLVVDADEIVHGIYEDKRAIENIADVVPAALTSDNKIDRSIIRRAILHDHSVLQEIEDIVTPSLALRMGRALGEASRDEPHRGIVVVDAPTMFEMGIERYMNSVLVLDCPREIQMERALSRPGMTLEWLELLMSRQLSNDERIARAQHVIDTTQPVEDVLQKVDRLLVEIELLK